MHPLGHLGQAYLWNFGLLPYEKPAEATFMLQDYDLVVSGNYSSQLLCERNCIGRKKTRVCAEWLQARGFETTITERRFDESTKRTADEPFVACCGFDAAKPRRLLERAGFDLVVECALGADASRFDRIIMHIRCSRARRGVLFNLGKKWSGVKLMDGGRCTVCNGQLIRAAITRPSSVMARPPRGSPLYGENSVV
jgi:hypothetical protein